MDGQLKYILPKSGSDFSGWQEGKSSKTSLMGLAKIYILLPL